MSPIIEAGFILIESFSNSVSAVASLPRKILQIDFRSIFEGSDSESDEDEDETRLSDKVIKQHTPKDPALGLPKTMEAVYVTFPLQLTPPASPKVIEQKEWGPEYYEGDDLIFDMEKSE